MSSAAVKKSEGELRGVLQVAFWRRWALSRSEGGLGFGWAAGGEVEQSEQKRKASVRVQKEDRSLCNGKSSLGNVWG